MLPPRELERLRVYLRSLISNRQLPPTCGGRPDWLEIARECGIAVGSLERASGILGPGLDAIIRFVAPRSAKRKESEKRVTERNLRTRPTSRRRRSMSRENQPEPPRAPTAHRKNGPEPSVPAADPASEAPRRKRGMKPKPIVEFPDPLWTMWEEIDAFTDALRLHMESHGDSCWQLYRAIVRTDENFDRRTLLTWL